MKSNNKLLFIFSLLFIMVMVYSKSWLPGFSFFGKREAYITVFLCFFLILIGFNFYSFVNLEIKAFSIETKILYLLTLIFLFSTLMFNSHEFLKLNNLIAIIGYSLVIIIYFYWVPKLLFENEKYFDLFIRILINFGLYFSLFGFIAYALNFAKVNLNTPALVSIIGHPNNASMVLTITLLPTLFYIFWKWKSLTLFSRTYYLTSMVLQLVAQLFTFTRAGMIACFIGFVMFFMLYYRKKFILIFPFFIVSIPLFVFSFFQTKGFGSFLSRFILLLPAYEMITSSREKMLWGFGITESLEQYKKNVVFVEENINDPHNSYVTLVLMLGIIFTIILLIFVGIILFKSIKAAIKSSPGSRNSLFYIFISTSAVSIFIQGIFDAELVKIDYYTIHYLLIVLGLMYLSLKKDYNPAKSILFNSQ